MLVSRDQSAVNMADGAGQTPLHAAVITGNVNVVEALLNHGSDINAADNERHTAVHWAVGLYVGHLDCMTSK